MLIKPRNFSQILLDIFLHPSPNKHKNKSYQSHEADIQTAFRSSTLPDPEQFEHLSILGDDRG